MNFLVKRIPLIIPLFIFVVFAALFIFPNVYFLIIALFASVIISTILLILLVKEKLKDYWPTVVQLIILIFTSSLFTLLISNPILYHLYLLAIAIFDWYVLSTLFRFLYQPRLYQPYSLEKASSWLIFISLFCLTAELSAFYVFKNISLWLTLLPFLAANLWLLFYFCRTNKINPPKPWLKFFVLGLVSTELYFGLNFLPINFHLNGLILSILNIIILQLWLKTQKLKLPINQNDSLT